MQVPKQQVWSHSLAHRHSHVGVSQARPGRGHPQRRRSLRTAILRSDALESEVLEEHSLLRRNSDNCGGFIISTVEKINIIANIILCRAFSVAFHLFSSFPICLSGTLPLLLGSLTISGHFSMFPMYLTCQFRLFSFLFNLFQIQTRKWRSRLLNLFCCKNYDN